MRRFCHEELGDKVFISTGAGIAPFRSMVLGLLDEGFTKGIYLLCGYRYEEDELFGDELRSCRGRIQISIIFRL